MKTPFLALPALVAVVPVAAQTTPYRALGTEPFWSLRIDEATIRLDEIGRSPVVVAAPVPRPTFNGYRYEAGALTVDVTRAPCSDGMSDRRFPETVTVRTGRRTLRGCGGVPVGGATAPVRLNDTRWTIAAVDGVRIATGWPPEIAFSGERVSGSTGCNRFGGDYTFAGGRLTTRSVFATRMTCPGDAMQIEAHILALLDQPLAVSAPGRDTVLLIGSGGSMMLKRLR